MPDFLGQQSLQGIPFSNKYSQTNTPWGQARVKNEAAQLFLDTFNTSIDTINKWNLSNGGGGVLPAYSGASATCNSGTTANGFSLMSSKNVWQPSEPAFLEFAARVNIESPVLTTGYRFFGLANAPASPTVANPITDGVGFEIRTNGAMHAVSYAGGALVFDVDLSAAGSAAQPANAAAHKYYIVFRPDLCFWAIDQPDNYVAVYTTGAFGPNNNALADTFLAISNGGTAVTIVNNGTSVSDSGRNGSQQYLWNGFVQEPQRSNTDTNSSLTVLSAQGTGTVNSADQINTNGRGLILVVNITAITAGSLTVTIQGKDVVSGVYYTLLASAALASTGTTVMTIYPGETASANVAANSPLPRTWRVSSVVATGPVTATVGASVIV